MVCVVGAGQPKAARAAAQRELVVLHALEEARSQAVSRRTRLPAIVVVERVAVGVIVELIHAYALALLGNVLHFFVSSTPFHCLRNGNPGFTALLSRTGWPEACRWEELSGTHGKTLFPVKLVSSPKMNWLGMGSGTVQDLVAAYDGTSELPFLRLEAGSVFLAV
jgi:hypothetical protein